MKRKFAILSEKKWNKSLVEELSSDNIEWVFIREKKDFTYKNLVDSRIDKIFIPHWSYIIPEEIFANFECVVFHMTDLPFGRGGSPLQNLIDRGFKETKISALKVVKELDGGPIYLKKDLSLYGTAEEIFYRSNNLIKTMIKEIIEKDLNPIEQKGKIVEFKRRVANQSDITSFSDIERIYDYIRMLDAEGYPKAYIKTDNFKIEFTRASLKADQTIIADAKIIINQKKENE
ncbi:methionyl-tRNA formyltransferase [Flavobacteriaceae bacterium UJ101]|nr:methionyl-tRNA formyltransferase [Flavobacteriaceae bacterium UJ101]